jgi:hypothetical protein
MLSKNQKLYKYFSTPKKAECPQTAGRGPTRQSLFSVIPAKECNPRGLPRLTLNRGRESRSSLKPRRARRATKEDPTAENMGGPDPTASSLMPKA